MLPSIFRSTTLRLTGWYLLILMLLSIMFSVVIYQVASSEISARLNSFQTNLQESDDGFMIRPMRMAASLQAQQVSEAKENISIELLYVNLLVFVVGGFGSYFLARRSLMPIEKAHEAQSRFTSDASHELRTPLAVMKLELETVLRDNNANTDELKEVLSSNLEEVNKLSKLAEMLLNLSRSDHSKLKSTPVNLDKLTHNIVNDFKFASDRIVIKSKKRLIVPGDETAIAELIKVLIDNALQYSPKNSIVYIILSKQDSNAKFEITNSGPGINADKLPHIFDRFFRADSSRTNGAQKGYGLGLSLAKSIIELHGGELIASSTPNHETTFTFLLALNSNLQAKSQN